MDMIYDSASKSISFETKNQLNLGDLNISGPRPFTIHSLVCFLVGEKDLHHQYEHYEVKAQHEE